MRKFKMQVHYKKQLADTLTPVRIYLKLRDYFPQVALLESADYHRRDNSYSFIGCGPLARFVLDRREVRMEFPDQTEHVRALGAGERATTVLRDFMDYFEFDAVPSVVQRALLMGYTAFDAVPYLEDIVFEEKEGVAMPEMQYALYRYLIVIDHFKNELYLIQFGHRHAAAAPFDLDALSALLYQSEVTPHPFRTVGGRTSNQTDADYLELIEKAKAHCQRGDVFQLVLSRRFAQAFEGDEFNVYRALRSINPSPYLFYFDYGDFKLFGSSPEAQLTVQSGQASIYPIAGTYPRTGNVKEDALLAEQLRQDPKEQAEHVMLVDLARNDLNRHAQNVRVVAFSEVQYFSHVIHLVSKVTGEVEPDQTLDVVADTFPAGTLSGAPKYRALQLIRAYEPTARAYYGGAIGFIGFDGSYNHAIMIRSFLSSGQALYYQAGAGIVVSSKPAHELQEVYNKVAALEAALTRANHFFSPSQTLDHAHLSAR